MNREIIFRAKQPHNGEWMEGYFSKDYAGVAYITTLDGVSTGVVDESTLGQFTGLTDKNGAMIWEGDIVNVLSTSWEYEVKFQKGCFKLVHIGKNSGLGVWGAIYRIEEKGFEIEVIGTIHDTHLTKQS